MELGPQDKLSQNQLQLNQLTIDQLPTGLSPIKSTSHKINCNIIIIIMNNMPQKAQSIICIMNQKYEQYRQKRQYSPVPPWKTHQSDLHIVKFHV